MTRAAGAAIRYGEAGAAAAGFGSVRVTGLPLPAVVERLREAIAAAGFWVLHEIDPQAIVARDGHRIGPMRQILFFHPDRMVRLLAADVSALPEAPLKFVAVAMPDGTVTVRWLDPSAALGRYGVPALAELGRELAAACERIAADALRTPAG